MVRDFMGQVSSRMRMVSKAYAVDGRKLLNAKKLTIVNEEWPLGRIVGCRRKGALGGTVDLGAHFATNGYKESVDHLGFALGFEFNGTIIEISNKPREVKAWSKAGSRHPEAHTLNPTDVMDATTNLRHRSQLRSWWLKGSKSPHEIAYHSVRSYHPIRLWDKRLALSIDPNLASFTRKSVPKKNADIIPREMSAFYGWVRFKRPEKSLPERPESKAVQFDAFDGGRRGLDIGHA
jgi:hypothetical protein